MRNILVYIGISFTAIALSTVLSCSILFPDDSNDASYPIDSDVIFRVYEGWPEGYSEQVPAVLLEMETEKIYSCYNFKIVADVELRDREVQINLHRVYSPDVCPNGSSPARMLKILPLDQGIYTLRIIRNRSADEYDLVITESSIQITGTDTAISRTENELNWRVPPQSFSCRCYSEHEDLWLSIAFTDSLSKIPNIIEFTFPDSGGVPYPEPWWHGKSVIVPKYYRYSTEADYDSACAFVQYYSNEVVPRPTYIHIALRNWLNTGCAY
jgi:hypothetical protein